MMDTLKIEHSIVLDQLPARLTGNAAARMIVVLAYLQLTAVAPLGAHRTSSSLARVIPT